MRVLDRLRSSYGVVRSLCIYYGSRRRARAMRTLYGAFVPNGGLAFDIGSHVGDRVACFRGLGARVVAVEPQPVLARTLRLLYRRDESVSVVEAAVGAQECDATLHLNLLNPTVATASTAFLAAADGKAGWKGQRWTRTRRVGMLTFDDLIHRHGRPDFAKIDVEGFEAEVLAGLSVPLSALSFEFTTIQMGIALDCVQRCSALGRYRFNAALGESQQLLHRQWLDSNGICAWLSNLPEHANSGDVYARLTGA